MPGGFKGLEGRVGEEGVEPGVGFWGVGGEVEVEFGVVVVGGGAVCEGL